MASSTPREPHPDPQALTSNPSNNSKTGVDYEPHPEASLPVSEERRRIVDSICALYSGSASEKDMMVCLSFPEYVTLMFGCERMEREAREGEMRSKGKRLMK